MAITYPVDVENTKWAFYRLSTDTILKHNVSWPRADGEEILGLDPDIIPLMEIVEAIPAYDPSTHKIQEAPPTIDVNANTHTHGWTVVPYTQEELDNEAEKNQAIAIYLDLKNGVGTSGERLLRVERVAAHLLKLQYEGL